MGNGVRSATVMALEPTVAVKVPGAHFKSVAMRHNEVLLCLLHDAHERLRQRTALMRTPNSKPRVFIGSSSEALPLAKAFAECLGVAVDCTPVLWNDPHVFKAGETAIESLTLRASEFDFAVLVCTADDVTRSRKRTSPSPRDNVVWEHGLFTGEIGRERAFLLVDRVARPKVPSDLFGLNVLVFENASPASSGTWASSCEALAAIIAKEGPRR